jgi:glycosyltransferase involved in cell wall biosynthesis
LVSSRSAAIVTVSKHDEQLGRPVVSSRIPIRTIYNSVPDLPKEVSAGGRVNTSRQVPRIVSVARLDDQKDHATLLEALSRIDYLGWELVLVGDGPLAETVKNLARESGLSDRVKFLGYCPAVADELAKSDMFVLSSHYEGLPRSIIEAMRSSLPVVATAVGGVDELVLDGVSGYLVERRDVSALASSIARLLVDPSRRRAFGTAGRERYLANHSFDMFVDRMEALYVAVLSEMQ